MQLNKVLKGLMIALPVMAVTACSSTDEATSATSGTESNQTTSGSEGNVDTTVVTPIDANGQLSEQELKEQALRETQTIYFAFDNSTIAGDYEEMLAAHAAYLVKNVDMKVTIEGHADERGTPEYNIALGERRAQAVAKYLQALGVQADQISIVSYGEEKPLLLGQSEDVYAKNRRAVLVY
ncbi:peptidoglycan-associated outer membrane lipoprotein Pal [Vibrio chagasii]|jgi:peptidoglycan-associated lipoprotein|uniref:Peptidoglycan-associated lipoprotein n=1 Tax=Vibrio chagasii TaxID=170679 RepID=A0A2S7VFM8_9VIBR|nr:MULTISPECIES: peptidoglycan-associated lipoprotein Pal [Vibrio]EDK28634.1 peptidoglycan-associated lipoprotein [Vibrionales bacterium SWAT-3]MDE9379843.1 peptidoglycan-associated lipoprotein Pal [Vibrio alginolyticus]EGU40889.1 peptidoglycan-associated lipoprotein [Vibrio splendidus ATCC 33789]KAB0474310.1 peptidoglycan-associated lipoprotein Pal [Vibrio chagasii]KZX67916.1 peptidoglycan-associated lipoprotein [Vibrio sp. HI00D65]|tara:strand:- start:705 stop:1247 length:543 start_codon:yes stop_codon:yes gene_type:complete